MQHRKRNRMIGFDYSSNAIYFVTICCKNKIHYFGKIENNEMILNDLGEISKNQIHWLAMQYKYVLIHNFVVMPNHVHILFEIDVNAVLSNHNETAPVVTGRDLSQMQNDDSLQQVTSRDLLLNPNTDSLQQVTSRDLSLRGTSMKIKSISQLIGAYKTTSSKQIHELGYIDFVWQRSFHDHIVRHYDSYNQIYNYISQNVEKWNEDSLKGMEL